MTFRTAILFGVATLSVSGSAQADDCALVRAASVAGISRPYAVTVTMPSGTGLPVTHMVMTGTKMYMQVRRSWTTKAMTSKELIDKMNEADRKAQMTCTKSGDEAVDGQPATIYAVETKISGQVTHSRIWISKSDGLPLKTEFHVRDDVMTSVFDYKNVAPPPGVK